MTALAPRPFRLDRLPSPIGTMLLVVDDADAVVALDFDDYEARMRRLLRRYHGAADTRDGAAPLPVRDALAAYFAGDVASLSGLPRRPAGTAFQRRVWDALCSVPPGSTESYGRLALRIGSPTAVRAVGLANGANPVGIAVPCHRVIGAAGALTGYGGGLPRKLWLLRHEGVEPATLRLPREPAQSSLF